MLSISRCTSSFVLIAAAGCAPWRCDVPYPAGYESPAVYAPYHAECELPGACAPGLGYEAPHWSEHPIEFGASGAVGDFSTVDPRHSPGPAKPRRFKSRAPGPPASPGPSDGFFSPWFGIFDGWLFGFGNAPSAEWHGRGGGAVVGDFSDSTVRGCDDCVDPAQEFRAPKRAPRMPHGTQPGGFPNGTGRPGFRSRPPASDGARPLAPTPTPMPPTLESPVASPEYPAEVGPDPTPRPLEPPPQRPMSTPEPTPEPTPAPPEARAPLTVPPALLEPEPEPLPAQETRGLDEWRPRRS